MKEKMQRMFSCLAMVVFMLLGVASPMNDEGFSLTLSVFDSFCEKIDFYYLRRLKSSFSKLSLLPEKVLSNIWFSRERRVLKAETFFPTNT